MNSWEYFLWEYLALVLCCDIIVLVCYEELDMTVFICEGGLESVVEKGRVESKLWRGERV